MREKINNIKPIIELNEIGCLVNNYLNEERYALYYCKGKFNSRRWGKIKITNHLKNKGLDMTTINKGLNEISNKTKSKASSS